MSTIRAIIVEDEETSRSTLRNYLSKYCPQVRLVGEASNVAEGVRVIREESPDLIFLDVEMPYGNGFDLLESIDGEDVEVIFVTAFSNYAVRALNMSASYYLLKPIDIDELQEAVNKAEANILAENKGEHTGVLLDNLKNGERKNYKLTLPTMDGFEVVELGQVVRARANDNLTDFHLTDGSKKVVCKTLKFFDDTLTDLGFLRVHKSHLINMDHVKAYKKGSGGYALMSDASEVEIAVRRKKAFLEFYRQSG